MGIDQASPQARTAYLAALKLESDRVEFRIATLSQEMMRLPLSKRRQSWHNYYRELGSLMERREELAKVLKAFTPGPPV